MWGIPDEETDQYFMIFAIRDIGINGAVVREKEKIPDDYPVFVQYHGMRLVNCGRSREVVVCGAQRYNCEDKFQPSFS